MVITPLTPLEDEDEQTTIDNIVESSDGFESASKAFVGMAATLEKNVSYYESDFGGVHKIYRATDGDLVYTLKCRVNVERPDSVSFEIGVRPHYG